MSYRSKQLRTLSAIFDSPIRAGISWREVESLLVHLGAEVTQGNGSRIRVYLNGRKAVFHKPHPQKEIDKGALRSIKKFLIGAGITPE